MPKRKWRSYFADTLCMFISTVEPTEFYINLKNHNKNINFLFYCKLIFYITHIYIHFTYYFGKNILSLKIKL